MLNLNNKIKQLILALMDVVLVSSALYFALVLRFEGQIPAGFLANLEGLLLPVVLINLVVLFFLGLYRRLWRYASVDEILLVILAVTLTSAGALLYSWQFELMLPRSVYVIFWFMLLFFLGASRFSLRLLSSYLRRKGGHNGDRRALIVGAGDAGALVAEEIKKHQGLLGIRPVGFIDDDPNKRGQVIQGIPVLGGREKIPRLVQEKKIAEVVIAMPSTPYALMREIIGICEGLEVKIKTVPGIFEILEGHVGVTRLKEVEIEDLLKRTQVKVEINEIADYLAGRVVLVTGAGGSIGSELCRQVSLLGPRRLIMLDHDENGVFYIHREMEVKFSHVDLCPLVRDIQSRDSLEKVFREFRPHVVFHAAAYKHVPLMELNVEEAVKNNIRGGKNLVDLSARYGVERFVLISTDKAVNPGSVMGATKRVSEIYLQQVARRNGECVFCAVRFGNVLGSRGSVVTLFREQIARGGPVTVTHPEMTRYFMTIPEAVQLVVQAGALGQRGEIFVLDMGEPIKIMELAQDMILLSGLQPGKDVEIKVTGIRPGEKLNEELFNYRENFALTRHERIFVAPDTECTLQEIEKELQQLGGKLQTDLAELLELDKIPGDVANLKRRNHRGT